MHERGRDSIEAAFRRARQELDIRGEFPADALEEVARVVERRVPSASAERTDHTGVAFVTIDPPGSRDLDQAVHAERAGAGYRLRYAIADVGFWVDRGGAIEREAWRRGVTFYAPDHRVPLYPPALSEGAASLLEGKTRPVVLFEFLLDKAAELQSWSVAPALVRSRAQLTYTQLLQHGLEAAASSLAGEAWAETLTLLAEIGPKRLILERGRGGVSLPIRDQHVQQRAAAALGYELVYEQPNAAESWNAQVSLLTGHAAATRMLASGVGLLRTMPTFAKGDVAKFRRIARTLGFTWPAGQPYPEFMHGLDPAHPRIDVLVRQARGVMRGAEYVAFDGAPPAQPLHGALAFTYAHVTAPLRRLADRYVLDLLVVLASGGRPRAEEIATLGELPPVMSAATRKANALERRVVDVAEAWVLRDRVGDVLPAVVIDVHRGAIEVQVEEPPLRASIAVGAASAPALGARIEVRVVGVAAAEGVLELERVG